MDNSVSSWPDMIITTTWYIFLYKNNKFSIFAGLNSYDRNLNGSNSLLYCFYGLTWNNKNVYIADNDIAYKLKIEDELIYKEKLDYTGKGIHQICCYGDKLYVMNTGCGLIDILDTNNNDKLIKKYFHHEKRWLNEGEKTQDHDHINSIFLYNDCFYICAHNHNSPSFIRKFDRNFKFLKNFNQVGRHNHNVYVEGESIYTLDSRNNAITVVDLKDGSKKRTKIDIKDKTKYQTFLRGMAKTKDYFFIGVTKDGEMRENRDHNASWIVKVNNNLEVVDCIELPERSQIREIRIIDGSDLAHNEMEYPL